MNAPRFHHWLLPVCAIVLICAGATCQQPVGTGSVRGTIYLADTRAPAAGTFVSLIPLLDPSQPKIDPQTGEYVLSDKASTEIYARVDASGSFEIDGVSPGDYFVLTPRPGYLSQREYIYPGALSPDVNPGQRLPEFVQKVHVTAGNAEQINLLLERGGAIEGTVSFSGVPQGNRTGIAVNVEIKTGAGRFIRALGAAHTDSDGHFRVDGLPPASYVIFLALPGTMRLTARGDKASGGEIIFCCNSTRASRARVLEIRGKEIYRGIDIEVPTTELRTVTGRAVTESGEPIREGFVRLYPTGERDLARTSPIQANGEFFFDHVIDEDYTVSIEPESHSEFVGPTPDGTRLIMRLVKPAFLPVQQDIHVAGQNPPPLILKVKPAYP